MSREQLQKPYKQRFKGVETFLRRVAFNLGNTASQTEVKIISCIPIDVTDLQQKIINLEKQLHEVQQQGAQQGAPVDEPLPDKASKKPSAVVNTALYGSTFAKQSSTVSYCSNKPIETIKSGEVATCCGSFSSRAKKSNVSFVFPALSAPDTKKSCDFNPRKGFSNDNAAAIERCKNIFRKRKRKKVCRGNSKMKTHLVYYAQTDNSYNLRKLPESIKYNEILNSNDKLCMSHLNNVIRRQYNPKEVVEEFSDTSNFSRPICRDIENKSKHFNQYDSDVCSCCHGQFQNIDNYMTKTNYDLILTKLHNSLDNTKVYYDSNHYDIIPVKENNNNLIKYNVEQKKDNKRLEIKCWPEPLRTRQKCVYPLIVNYNTETPAKRKPNTRPQPTTKRERKKPKVNINQEKIRKSEQKTSSGTSKSCYIDYSDIYPKQEFQQLKPRKTGIVKSTTRKNESVETEEVITKLVSNQSTQLELIENCKEITLNEIKTILQYVLEEVKTNAKPNVDETLKRDAVVQKGESQNSLPGESTLLHSYTYNNSYNANPYAPSCSKQIPGISYYVPNIPCQPVKCLQNFPVFVQPRSGRHLCTCFYKKGSCRPHNKPEVTTATNTAPSPNNKIDMSSSKETEKLIKEIYKSIALNMDFPTKESSTSEYNDLKSDKLSTNVVDAKNKDMSNKSNGKIETSVSPILSNINENIIDGTAFNTLAGDAKQVTKPRFIKAESTGNINKDKYVQRLELNSIPSADTIVEDDEDAEEYTEESDSTSTVVQEELEQHKKRSKGFFGRMLKSVKLFKKKKQTREEKDASNSDDYETIYSEKSVKASPRYYRTKDHIKSRNFDPNERKRDKRSPYLEQEYRRYWNERLAFREQESKSTSERSVSKHSSINNPRPVFWNNYEARSAIVNHRVPNQRKTIDTQNHIKYDTLQKNYSVQKMNKGGLGWLKKHKFGINCGAQWKKFILEN